MSHFNKELKKRKKKKISKVSQEEALQTPLLLIEGDLDHMLYGQVIDYGEGELQHGEITGPTLVANPPLRQGKTFTALPFIEWKHFAPPPLLVRLNIIFFNFSHIAKELKNFDF